MPVDDFLVGLNHLSPNVSLEATPANGPSDPSNRSAFDLSYPADPAAVAAQLDLWTSVNFDFDSPLNPPGPPPPSFDRAFDHRSLGDGADSFKAPFGQVALPSTISPDLTLGPWNGAGVDQSFMPPAASIAVNPNDAGRSIGEQVHDGRHPGNHTTGVGTEGLTPAAIEDEDSANRKAIEEDKRRRNTLASGTRSYTSYDESDVVIHRTARFRVKKKQREQALEQSAKELQDRVGSLEKEVEALQKENGWLRNLVLDRVRFGVFEVRGSDGLRCCAQGVSLENAPEGFNRAPPAPVATTSKGKSAKRVKV